MSSEPISKTIDATSNLLKGKATTRQENDANSNSWLSQNIRPIMTLYVLLLVSWMMYSPDRFGEDLQALLFALLADIVKFYFVAKTSERVLIKLIERRLK